MRRVADNGRAWPGAVTLARAARQAAAGQGRAPRGHGLHGRAGHGCVATGAADLGTGGRGRWERDTLECWIGMEEAENDFILNIPAM